MNEPLRGLLLTLLVGFGALAVLLVLALVGIRAAGELLGRVTERRRDGLRHLILAALLGDPAESSRALEALRAREGRSWQHVEQQAFAMLPKIKGESREVLVALLEGRGAADHAYANAGSWSLVRRSRGAYQFGALGHRESVPALLRLLGDKHFLVRRTAVRALGQIGDADAVPPLLDAVTDDPALVRDVIAALQRIGPAAVPHLRRDLELFVEAERVGRRGALVATVLGLHGDIGSVRSLVRAVDTGHEPSLQAAAAEALGAIGVPSAVPALAGALENGHAEVRIKAAVALGRISDASAVPALVSTLGSGVHTVDRAVAGALLHLGRPGHEALEAHPSPYAAEALAVHGMRSPA